MKEALTDPEVTRHEQVEEWRVAASPAAWQSSGPSHNPEALSKLGRPDYPRVFVGGSSFGLRSSSFP